MKIFQKLTDARFAKLAARFMEYVCYLVMGLCTLCMVLSFLGRQSFSLHTSAGTFERAICAEEDHSPHSRSLTVSMGDDIRVRPDGSGRIDLPIQLALSLMYAVHVLPLIAAFWLLSRVFANIQDGQIFTEQNSLYLLYYGLLQFSAAVFVPVLKLLICKLASMASGGQIQIATGQSMMNAVIPSISFIVAAYIIHYGVNLQDEVDHTL